MRAARDETLGGDVIEQRQQRRPETGDVGDHHRLVMQAQLAGRAVIIVLLDSWGKNTRSADALRVRQWLEAASGIKPPTARKTGARKPLASRGASPKAQTTIMTLQRTTAQKSRELSASRARSPST